MDSPRFEYKLKWMARFKEFLGKNYSPSEPLIWCGDLNVAPEDIDVHNPKRLLGHVDFNPLVWEAFEDIKGWGLVDPWENLKFILISSHLSGRNKRDFFDFISSVIFLRFALFCLSVDMLQLPELS